MDASGGAGGIPGGMVAKRSAENLMVDYSSVGSSPVNSPTGGVYRSISPGSNGDGCSPTAKLNSLYKEIGWLKIKLLSARDEPTDNKAGEYSSTRGELQARLDSRVAEHAALLNQREQASGPAISEAAPSPTPPRSSEVAEAEAVAEAAREELRHAQEAQHAPATKEELRKAQLHTRLSRAGFLGNDRSAPEAEQVKTSELVTTGEGVSETAGTTEMAGGDLSSGAHDVVQPSSQDEAPEPDASPDAHVPPSSPSVVSQSTSPLDGAVASARKAAESAAAVVSKAIEAASARTSDVEKVQSSIGTLSVRIIAAHNLKNSDSGIFGDVSDPFVIVRVGSVEHKTEVIDNNLNPVWDSEPFPFSVDLSAPEQRTVNLEVFNHNNFFAHKSLGTLRVDSSGLTVGSWQQRREHLQDGGRGAELEFAMLYTLGVTAADGSSRTALPAPEEPATATATDVADTTDAAQEPRQLHDELLEKSPEEPPRHHEGLLETSLEEPPIEEPPQHHEGLLERAKHGLAHMLHLDGGNHKAEGADASVATDSAPMPEPEPTKTLEPDLGPMPPMPTTAPPNRNSKKQLVKLRGLMDTLQKEAQASHKERAALENRARRLDKQLQAVQARTMRSERAEDERKKAEAEMATLRRALNARLKKEAKRQPAVQPAAETPERVATGTTAVNTMELPLSARRSMTPVTSAADFPMSLRRDMAGPHTPRMTRSLSRPETGRTKAPTRAVATRLRPRNATATAATPSSPSQALPSGPSAVTDSAPSLTSVPLSGSPPWMRGCRLGPGLPATPRGESPFRQHSPPRSPRGPRRTSSPSPGAKAKAAGSSPPRERQSSPSTRAEGTKRQQKPHNAHVWRQPSEGSDDGSSALEEETLKWHEPRGRDEVGSPSVPQLVFDRVRSDVTVNSFGGSNSPRGSNTHSPRGSPRGDEGAEDVSPSKTSAPSVMDVFDEGAQRYSGGEWMQQFEEAPACYVATWEDSERGTSEVATLPPTPAQPVGRETLPGSAQPTVQSGNDGGAGASSGPLPSWTTCTAADQVQMMGAGTPGHERVPSPLFDRAAPVPTRGSAAFSELGTSTATAVAAAVASASAVLSHSRNNSSEHFEEVSRSQMGSANTADSLAGETGMVFYPLAEEEPMTAETLGHLEGSLSIEPSLPTQQTRALAWRSPDYHGITAAETDPGAAAVAAAVASSAAVSSGSAPDLDSVEVATAESTGATAASSSAKAEGSSSGASPLLRLWSPPPAPRDVLGVATSEGEADGKQPPAGMRRSNPRSLSRRNSPSPGAGTGEPAGRGDGPTGGARPAAAATALAFGSRSPSRTAAGTSTSSTAQARKSSPGQRSSPLASDGLSGGTASTAAKPSGTGADEAWHHRLATTHTKSSHARREKRNAPNTPDLLEEAGRLLDSNQEPFRPFRRSSGSIGVANRSSIK